MSTQHARQFSRRRVLGVTLAGTAGLLGLYPRSAAAEPPPETTRIRLEWAGGTCQAPKYVAEELLRAEGFADVQYVHRDAKNLDSLRLQAVRSGEADFDLQFVPNLVIEVDKASPIVILAGQHVGCFELFARRSVRAVRDLKHKTIAVREVGTAEHLFLSVILSYVGLDPAKDVGWVTVPFPEAVRLLAEEQIDAVLGFPPLPQRLRAEKIGHVVLTSTTDQPWWQYFCCMVVGNREFVRRYPVATKRVVRALMKANEVCAMMPDQSAQLLVGKGDTTSYEYARQTLTEIPCAGDRLALSHRTEEGVEGIEGEVPMKQDQGAPSSPTDDVTTCEAPGLWSRQGSTVFLPFPASPKELTRCKWEE